MNILFIGPIPPPFNGQSLATKTCFDFFAHRDYNVILVNTAKPKRINSPLDFLNRTFEVVNFLIRIAMQKKHADIIYLSISESKFGNIKDILTYTILYSKLHKCTVHLLGGAGLHQLFSNGIFYKRINEFFYKKIRNIIVEGDIQADTFRLITNRPIISVIPNFAENYLFIKSENLDLKFKNTTKYKILYLSNLINGKGYNELLQAFLNLEESVRSRFELNFAGNFQNESQKKAFLAQLSQTDDIKYLGFLNGEAKRIMLEQTHIFCLPTYYPYEGQPLSIIESYASGCFVVTTNHSGIPFIFEDKINGYIVDKKSVDSIKKILGKIILNSSEVERISKHNFKIAKTYYTINSYKHNLAKLFP